MEEAYRSGFSFGLWNSCLGFALSLPGIRRRLPLSVCSIVLVERRLPRLPRGREASIAEQRENREGRKENQTIIITSRIVVNSKSSHVTHKPVTKKIASTWVRSVTS